MAVAEQCLHSVRALCAPPGPAVSRLGLGERLGEDTARIGDPRWPHHPTSRSGGWDQCTAETPSRNTQGEREGSVHQQIKLPGGLHPPTGMYWLPGPRLWLDEEESLARKGKSGSTATADSPGGILPALF